MAGYTYGPLLGLFLLGIFTKIQIKDKAVPFICVIAPIATYFLNYFLLEKLNFDLGFMNIFVNATLTILLLLLTKQTLTNDK